MNLETKINLRKGILASTDMWYSVEGISQAVDDLDKDIEEEIISLGRLIREKIGRHTVPILITILEEDNIKYKEILLNNLKDQSSSISSPMV